VINASRSQLTAIELTAVRPALHWNNSKLILPGHSQ
jgi:hypothetical protein